MATSSSFEFAAERLRDSDKSLSFKSCSIKYKTNVFVFKEQQTHRGTRNLTHQHMNSGADKLNTIPILNTIPSIYNTIEAHCYIQL